MFSFFVNNQYISYGKIIAKTFNNYFVTVGSSLVKNIPTETDPLHYIESLENSIYIPEIWMRSEQSYRQSQTQL